jgi:hypothetical protein
VRAENPPQHASLEAAEKVSFYYRYSTCGVQCTAARDMLRTEYEGGRTKVKNTARHPVEIITVLYEVCVFVDSLSSN